jgi:hypothetical protein
MASPKAKTGNEGAKTGMKIITAIHVKKNIRVGREPNRSWAHPLTTSPAN